jgi:hypothetical protein
VADWSFGETLLVAHTVGEALRSIGADWYVGGSVASSVHGIPRATQDADIVAALRPGHGKRLAEVLGEAFYLDADTAETAIRSLRSFNVIHLETMFKVDVFVLRRDAYGLRAMADRLVRVVSEEPPISLPVATPEDTVAHKLYWYRLANEESEKQWRDLVGVLKTLRGRLDVARLRLACSDLEVGDLVDGALEAAGTVSGLSTK